MKISFRQGIISGLKSENRPLYLQAAGGSANSVGINISPTPLVVTFAHGSSDYLHVFDTDVDASWGPLSSVGTSYLYWEIDLLTAELLFKVTALPPAFGTQPMAPVADQHWFDTESTTMKVWDGSGWANKVALFAGWVPSGSVANVQMYPIGVSQVALNTPSEPGYIMLDSQLRPLRLANFEFLTTANQVRIKTTSSTSGVLAVPPNAFVPVRATETIPAFSLVYFSGADSIGLASSDPGLVNVKTPVGVVQELVLAGDMSNVMQSGEIQWDQWDWSGKIGKPVYCGVNGEITAQRPSGLLVYRVGTVKNPTTILFRVDAETLPQVYQASSNDVIINARAPLSSSYLVNSANERVWTIDLAPSTISSNGYMSAAQATDLVMLGVRVSQAELDIQQRSIIGHTHQIGDVDGLQSALNTLMQSLTSKASIFELSEGLALKADVGHVHTAANIVDFSPSAIDVVRNTLVAGTNIELNFDVETNKLVIAATGGGSSGPMALSDLSDVNADMPQVDQVLAWNGTEWVPSGGTAPGGVGTGIGSPAGMRYQVQINDGPRFGFIPTGAEGQVLTAHGDATPTWESAQVSGGTVTSVDIDGDTTGLTFTGGPVETTGTFIVGGELALEHGGTGASNPEDAVKNLLGSNLAAPGSALISDGNITSWQVLPGSAYVAGPGINIFGTTISSTVADNVGNDNKVAITNGDGTLSFVPAGPNDYVLTSNGVNAPSWKNQFGTVSEIQVIKSDVVGLFITGGDPHPVSPNPLVKYIKTTGQISLGGTLSILAGGTGANTPRTALNALLPVQIPGPSGNGGMVLTTNGADAVWQLALPDQDGKGGMFLSTDGVEPFWTVPAGGGTVISVDLDGGITGLTFTGGPITQSGTITLGGVLGIQTGGTGASTPTAALNNLLPSQTVATAGLLLTSDGVNATWQPLATGGGTVTSVDFANIGNTTGLVFTGGPITTSGSFSIGGTLQIQHGGTGAGSAAQARTNILPVQVAADAGKVLVTDGVDVGWVALNGNVVSVDAKADGTGLVFSGGPITTSGTLALSGTLNVASGGTGANTPQTALNNLLPPQAAHPGKILTTDGSNTSWTTSSAGTVTSIDIDGSTTGLTFTGGPVTVDGTLILGGVLGLANGGTGETSAKAALNALLPVQTTSAGKILTTDGTDVSWTTAAAGSVTSVQASGGATGLTFTGGPITDNGVLTIGGVLSIQSGGTGATTAPAALTALLPSQAGNANKVLTSNGGAAVWETPAPTPAGLTTQVQYNNAGVLAGSANFTFNAATSTLNVNSLVSNGVVELSGGSVQTAIIPVGISTIDCNLGTYFTKTATGANTWVFAQPPASGKAYIFVLVLTNGAAGVQTWPTSVRWVNGTAPTLTSNTDVLIFSTHNGGATWRGVAQLNYTV